MKIAIFTGTIPLMRRDVRALYVIEVLKHLIKFEDLEITLIAPGKLPDELKSDKITHVSYFYYNRVHFKKISAMLSPIPKLSNIKYDLLHCFGHDAATIALLAKKFRKNKALILFEMLGLDFAESEINARFSTPTKIFRPYTVWKEKMLIKHSDGIITLTESVREYILKNFREDNVFAVPHGIDLEFFAKERERDSDLIDKYGLKNKKVILYTGAISPLSGILYLIKAMKSINKKIENTSLLILGNGPLTSLVKDYISKNQLNNVIFVGWILHEEIPRYHSIADVLVNPDVRCMQTELDAPTKLFEYLASGKPIVASNLKSIREVVGENAILVEPENPEALADGILKVLTDEKLAKKLGENGKKIAANYSWEESSIKAYDIYRKILLKN